ncbi:MAG: hypothetical protein ACNS62_08955 [Candidatus Cyclobacteriaceae bacterium M3_2C_046]
MKNFFKYLLVILGSALFFFSSSEKAENSETNKQTGLGYQVKEKALPVKTDFIIAK